MGHSMRYVIYIGSEKEGTRTLEDYHSQEACLEAFDNIRKRGFHVNEYCTEEECKTTFDVGTTIDMCRESWDTDEVCSMLDFEVEYESITIKPFKEL